MPLDNEKGHKWKKLLSDFDEDQENKFRDVLDAVGGDIFLLPKKCFDYFISTLPSRDGNNQAYDMIAQALVKKEHKSLGSKIDRALFTLNKKMQYAWEEIKDFFTNPDRGGGKFIKAMKDVFSAIKDFFTVAIPNFSERAWSQVRENVLIPAQKNINLAVSHVNEAIAKGFQPRFVGANYDREAKDLRSQERDRIKEVAEEAQHDEKLKRAMQGLEKGERESIKDIYELASGTSKKNPFSRSALEDKARAARDQLRSAAKTGEDVSGALSRVKGIEDIIGAVKEVRAEKAAQKQTSKRSRRDSGISFL